MNTRRSVCCGIAPHKFCDPCFDDAGTGEDNGADTVCVVCVGQETALRARDQRQLCVRMEGGLYLLESVSYPESLSRNTPWRVSLRGKDGRRPRVWW